MMGAKRAKATMSSTKKAMMCGTSFLKSISIQLTAYGGRLNACLSADRVGNLLHGVQNHRCDQFVF
jgi:hypothetical protein